MKLWKTTAWGSNEHNEVEQLTFGKQGAQASTMSTKTSTSTESNFAFLQ